MYTPPSKLIAIFINNKLYRVKGSEGFVRLTKLEKKLFNTRAGAIIFREKRYCRQDDGDARITKAKNIRMELIYKRE